MDEFVPPGRSRRVAIRAFSNEKGTPIRVVVTLYRKAVGLVIEAPDSEVSNLLTVREAQELLSALNECFAGEK